MPDQWRADVRDWRAALVRAGKTPYVADRAVTVLSAALGAARAGLDVTVVEQDFEFGGSLLNHAIGSPEAAWVTSALADLQGMPNVTLMSRATGFGLFGGNTVGVIEHAQNWLAKESAARKAVKAKARTDIKVESDDERIGDVCDVLNADMKEAQREKEGENT